MLDSVIVGATSEFEASDAGLVVTRDSDGLFIELLPAGIGHPRVCGPFFGFSVFGLFAFFIAAISPKVSLFEAAILWFSLSVAGLLLAYFNWRMFKEYVQIHASSDQLSIAIQGPKSNRTWEWDEPDLLAIRVFARSKVDQSEAGTMGLRVEWRCGSESDQVTILNGRNEDQLRNLARILRKTLDKPVSIE